MCVLSCGETTTMLKSCHILTSFELEFKLLLAKNQTHLVKIRTHRW